MEDFREEGVEMETKSRKRGVQPNSNHSQTYTNDPDRLRETEQPNDPHQP